MISERAAERSTFLFTKPANEAGRGRWSAGQARSSGQNAWWIKMSWKPRWCKRSVPHFFGKRSLLRLNQRWWLSHLLARLMNVLQ